MDSEAIQAWGDDELETIVRAYGEMLERERVGDSYVKVDANRAVQARTGRSKGSIEFKFCNISAVLQESGFKWVPGYAPRSNYQKALKEVVLDIFWTDYAQALQPTVGGGEQSDEKGEEVAAGTGTSASGLELGELWERATGGSAVAVSPTHQGSGEWPVGPGAPGADEVIDALLGRLENPESVDTDLVFLVGGPGNGKSELSRRAARDLTAMQSPVDGLAHRSYRYASGVGKPLVIINDATIPPEGYTHPAGALMGDITEAVRDGSSLLANVNRGILEESVDTEGIPGEIWEWIRTTAAGLTARADIQTVQAQDFRLNGERGAVAWVVLMDVCSLLERRPTVTVDPASGQATQTPYKIMELEARDLSGGDVPAAKLLREFADALSPEVASLPDWHPVKANIAAIAEDEFRGSLLTLLRAAELAAGRHFTYRELWGAFIRSILGRVPEDFGADEGLSWLDSRDPSQLHGLQKFNRLAELASLRVHEAIVGAGSLGAPRGDSAWRRHPVLRLTATVDPALDATPDWSRFVHEAMAFRDSSGPLETLMELEDFKPMPGVSAFDRMLDEAYADVVEDIDDVERRRIDSWYGAYLVRLYAMARSRPGFLEELNIWTKAWLATGKAWPEAIKAPLRTLLFPVEPGKHDMLLPVLEARARPLTGQPETPKLARSIDSSGMNIKKERRGESLLVTISMDEAGTAEVELDFDLLREARACRDGHPGLSDRAQSTLPRLERFRANLLRPENDFGYSVVIHDDKTTVELTR